MNCAVPISDCSVGQHWLNARRISEWEISAGWYCAWKKRFFPVASGGGSSWHTVVLGPRSSRRAASWKIGRCFLRGGLCLVDGQRVCGPFVGNLWWRYR